MELTYTERNGILYPDLTLPEQTHYQIGKYGMIRLDYLKKHRRGTYTTLLTEAKLNEHLHDIDVMAHEMLDSLINRIAEQENVTENLKAANPVEWVQSMYHIHNRSEEMVLHEIVFV